MGSRKILTQGFDSGMQITQTQTFREYIHGMKVGTPDDAIDRFRKDVASQMVPGDTDDLLMTAYYLQTKLHRQVAITQNGGYKPTAAVTEGLVWLQDQFAMQTAGEGDRTANRKPARTTSSGYGDWLVSPVSKREGRTGSGAVAEALNQDPESIIRGMLGNGAEGDRMDGGIYDMQQQQAQPMTDEDEVDDPRWAAAMRAEDGEGGGEGGGEGQCSRTSSTSFL